MNAPKRKPGARETTLLLLGLLGLPLWHSLSGVEPMPEAAQALPYLTVHALMWFNFTLALAACGLLGRKTSVPLERREWALVAGFSIAFHALAMAPSPLLETDPYRYLWDGKQLLHGINPFEQAPLTLAGLERPWYFKLINHPTLATIYPPLAQGAFLLSAWLAEDSLLMWKAFSSLTGLGAVALVAATLRNLGRDPKLVLFLLWNPLWIKEFGNSGHMDTVMLLPLAASLWAMSRGRDKTAAVTAGLSIAGKWASLALLPALSLGFRRRAWLALAPIIAGLSLIPFMLGERWSAPFESLLVFGRDWIFNAFVYDLITKPLEWLGLSFEQAGLAGKAVGGLLLLGWYSWLLRRNVAAPSVGAAAYFSTVVLLWVAPTIFPWYVSWALLLAPFAASLRGAWLWTLLAPLSYTYYISWEPVYWLKYLSFGILVWIMWKDLRAESFFKS